MKPLLAAAMVALSLGLIACGGSGSDPTSTSSSDPESTGSESAPGGEARKAEKARIVEFSYEPELVVVQVDGKVIWQNEDTAPHTATADDGSFDTGILEKGKLGSATFREPGTFAYHCEIHPTMQATVEVVD